MPKRRTAPDASFVLLALAVLAVFMLPYAIDSGMLPGIDAVHLVLGHAMFDADPNGTVFESSSDTAIYDAGEDVPVGPAENDVAPSNDPLLSGDADPILDEQGPGGGNPPDDLEGVQSLVNNVAPGAANGDASSDLGSFIEQLPEGGGGGPGAGRGPLDSWDTSGAAAHVSRAGLGHLYAGADTTPPPPLTTRVVSGYVWPASNTTAVFDELEPPPPGMDPQVWRDFRPWRGRRFSMHDIDATRRRRNALLTEHTPYSHEIFTTVIKDGVPYYLTSEMKSLAKYKTARLLKLLDFVLQLHSVGKRYVLPDVHLLWTVLPNPLLAASSARDLVHAPSGALRNGVQGDIDASASHLRHCACAPYSMQASLRCSLCARRSTTSTYFTPTCTSGPWAGGKR